MPQSFSHSALEQLVYDIGQRLGQAMVNGLRASTAQTGAAPAPVKRGPGRPPRSPAEAKCLVPGCNRRSVAKKLCPTHYRKANRLKMTGTLSEADLALLSKDGRATRWEKKPAKTAPKKAAKRGRPAKKARKASRSGGEKKKAA